MSLESVVFEESSGGGGGGAVCNICLFEMEGKVCLQVCVFQSAPAPYLCLLCVYVIHELDLNVLRLCLCVFVCVSVHPGESDKVPVHFPRFTNHFHGLTTQSDIFPYNRVRSATAQSPLCLCFHTLSYSSGTCPVFSFNSCDSAHSAVDTVRKVK